MPLNCAHPAVQKLRQGFMVAYIGRPPELWETPTEVWSTPPKSLDEYRNGLAELVTKLREWSEEVIGRWCFEHPQSANANQAWEKAKARAATTLKVAEAIATSAARHDRELLDGALFEATIFLRSFRMPGAGLEWYSYSHSNSLHPGSLPHTELTRLASDLERHIPPIARSETMSVEDTATKIGVTIPHVYKLIRRGKIKTSPGTKLPLRSSVEAYRPKPKNKRDPKKSEAKARRNNKAFLKSL
jgi:hypothetical protein